MTVFVLGGAQTDFARNYGRQQLGIADMMKDALSETLSSLKIEPRDIDALHVGNFTGELFSGQGHLGGVAMSLHEDLAGVPTARHEAACASGSVAIRAACAELEAGWHDIACVIGVEEMKNVSGFKAAEHLGVAAFAGREAQSAKFVWPHLFDRVLDAYDDKYGLDHDALWLFAKNAFENAKRNPFSQTRGWSFSDASFTGDDEHNPLVEGRLRRHDCSQITDGAACVLLATEAGATRYAKQQGLRLDDIPRILGQQVRTAPMLLDDKLEKNAQDLFPMTRATADDARAMAGKALADVDAFEIHDCFSITAAILVEHLGLAEAGGAADAIRKGQFLRAGATPVNPGGGLIGTGHPVGATGVRMVLDAYRQVTGQAGACQVEGARTVQTLNIGGSLTTNASFVIGV